LKALLTKSPKNSHMRAVSIWIATLAMLAVGADAWAAGGVYATAPSRDAAACARICADDSLCIAWSYGADGACSLRATAPASPIGEAHGFSARAPAALRAEAATLPAAAQTVNTTRTGEADQPPVRARAEDETSLMLLGGLETDATGLRN
jgi:hypothetical protein